MARSIDHPELGLLERRRGRWRGTLVLGGEALPLILEGGRSGPDARAVAGALAFDVGAARSLVEAELREHRSALLEGADPGPVWDDVTCSHLAVAADGAIEWGLAVAWDDDHTLGARFGGDGALVELNGSVLPP